MCAVCWLSCTGLQWQIEIGMKGFSSAPSPVPWYPSTAALSPLWTSLVAPRLSEAISPLALGFLECPCGASWLHLWVWVNWELSEKSSHDAKLRNSTCPVYLLWPTVVYPGRQESQGQHKYLLPGVPPQGSEEQLFQAFLIAQPGPNPALKARYHAF